MHSSTPLRRALLQQHVRGGAGRARGGSSGRGSSVISLMGTWGMTAAPRHTQHSHNKSNTSSSNSSSALLQWGTLDPLRGSQAVLVQQRRCASMSISPQTPNPGNANGSGGSGSSVARSFLAEWFERLVAVARGEVVGAVQDGGLAATTTTSTEPISSGGASGGTGLAVTPMRLAGEARLLVGGAAGQPVGELPDVVLAALWELVDAVFLEKSAGASACAGDDASSVEILCRQLHFLTLLAQAGANTARVEGLAERIRLGAATETTDALMRLADELRSAATPLHCRWLQQTYGSGGAGGAGGGDVWGAATSPAVAIPSDASSPGAVLPSDPSQCPPSGVQRIMRFRAAVLRCEALLQALLEDDAALAAAAGALQRHASALRLGGSGPAAKEGPPSSSSSATSSKATGPSSCVGFLRAAKAALRALDAHAFALLRTWMQHGEGVVLRELRWDDTPPAVLERIVAAEVVHPFEAPALLSVRRRMQPTGPRRLLYGFFHRAAPSDPLIAVQVALTTGIARSVDSVLGRPAAQPSPYDTSLPASGDGTAADATHAPPDTAIFYSINSAQQGLRGVDLGNALIKAVVRHLQQHHPHVATFSTLSPIPAYLTWLKAEVFRLQAATRERQATLDADDGTACPDKDLHNLEGLADAIISCQSRIFGPDISAVPRPVLLSWLTAIQRAVAAVVGHRPCHADLFADLLYLLSVPAGPRNSDATVERPALKPWWHCPEATSLLREPLTRSLTAYLAREKRRGRALDPVANFHIGNGATLLQVNWLANQTAKGSRESACMMVNYHYDLPCIAANAQGYAIRKAMSMGASIEETLNASTPPNK